MSATLLDSENGTVQSAHVSFDIFMQGFSNGDGGDGDGDAALAVLAPFITERAETWARVTTPDGGTDVFGIDRPSSGLMFNHTSGNAVWALLFDVARAGGFTVMPAGCSTCLPPGLAVEDLPEPLRHDVETISSGEDLRRVITDA